MKKLLVIFFINMITMTTIVSTIWSDFGLEYFLKIGLPITILVGTNTGALLTLLNKFEK